MTCEQGSHARSRLAHPAALGQSDEHRAPTCGSGAPRRPRLSSTDWAGVPLRAAVAAEVAAGSPRSSPSRHASAPGIPRAAPAQRGPALDRAGLSRARQSKESIESRWSIERIRFHARSGASSVERRVPHAAARATPADRIRTRPADGAFEEWRAIREALGIETRTSSVTSVSALPWGRSIRSRPARPMSASCARRLLPAPTCAHRPSISCPPRSSSTTHEPRDGRCLRRARRQSLLTRSPLLDLRGGRWAYNDPCSLSGYFSVLEALARIERHFLRARSMPGHTTRPCARSSMVARTRCARFQLPYRKSARPALAGGTGS